MAGETTELAKPVIGTSVLSPGKARDGIVKV